MTVATASLVLDRAVTARAHVNIALIKYWGKAPARRPEDANLPAVPSLSLTLDALYTESRVRFAPDARADRVVLDGRELQGKELSRAVAVLDRVRALAELAAPFEVDSVNHVPTAAGLASSASGMAALAAAAARAAGIVDPTTVSALARIGSGSAARSVFGGWVAWDGPAARPVAPVDHWDLALLVAVVDAGPKAIGSRDAMNHTARTSPYYGEWVQQAGATFDAGCAAVAARDFEALVRAMEVSTMRMHASAMAADPPVLYWQAASVGLMRVVERLRADGVPCGWTMDAGPNVKVLCPASAVETVRAALAAAPGVERIIVSRPGPAVWVEPGPMEAK